MNFKNTGALAGIAAIGVLLGVVGTSELLFSSAPVITGGQEVIQAGATTIASQGQEMAVAAVMRDRAVMGGAAPVARLGAMAQADDEAITQKQAQLGRDLGDAFASAPKLAAVSTPKGMNKVVWDRAITAYACALREGQIKPGAPVAIIDYDMPSSKKRLWLVDPDNPAVALNEWVTHGSGSGNLVAKEFSNTQDSHQTSLGVFRAAEVYQGKYGASLRLDGLEPGFNDAARKRAIVMHPAWYAEPGMIAKTGRLGRSQGCPAVRAQAIDEVRDALAGGGMLFAHASEEEWLEESKFLNCG